MSSRPHNDALQPQRHLLFWSFLRIWIWAIFLVLINIPSVLIKIIIIPAFAKYQNYTRLYYELISWSWVMSKSVTGRDFTCSSFTRSQTIDVRTDYCTHSYLYTVRTYEYVQFCVYLFWYKFVYTLVIRPLE